MKFIKLVFLYVFFNQKLIAQDSVVSVIQANVFSADILPHSEEIRSLSFSNPKGISIGYMWQNSASGNSLEKPLKSRKGLRFQYVNFNNTVQLGHSFSLSAFTEPMFGSNRKLFLSMPIEIGLVQVTKTYHPISNPENLFFSTPLSFFLNAGGQLNYKLNGQFLINLGMQYQHISNGGIRMPNKGMNFISVNAGISYYLKATSWEVNNKNFQTKAISKYLFEAYITGSAKTLGQTNEVKPIGGFQVSFLKPLNYYHYLSFASEAVYHTYNQTYFSRLGTKINPWMQSLLAGYALKIGKTSFQVLLGVPIINKTSNEKMIYQRYMLVQTIGKKWLIAGSLKAEGHIADIFDLRLGYRITR